MTDAKSIMLKETKIKTENKKTTDRGFGAGLKTSSDGLHKGVPKRALNRQELLDIKALTAALQGALDGDLELNRQSTAFEIGDYRKFNMAYELEQGARRKYGIVSSYSGLLSALADSGDVDGFLRLAELAVKVHLKELADGRGRLDKKMQIYDEQDVDLYAGLHVERATKFALGHAQTEKQVMRLLALLVVDIPRAYEVAQKALERLESKQGG